MTEASRRSPVTPFAITVGVAMVVWGVVGVFRNREDSHPLSLASWVVGADLVHDLLLIPIVSGLAWGLSRLVPAWARPPLLTGIGLSSLLVIVAWPFIAGYGRNPLVPSLLNRNYARGVGVYVMLISVACLGWAVLRRRRSRSIEGEI